MKKQIGISVAVIAVVAAITTSGTLALFSDTESSNGNIFTAGAIDLKVDHTKQTYNGEECVGDCEEIGSNLVVNGSFEAPDIATGSFQIFTDASQTSWTIEGGSGLEIQDNVAGAPHPGNGDQFAELDSNSSSSISQMIVTIPGQKYHLNFYYSPRPGRPSGDNGISTEVKVVSDGTILVEDEIGEFAVGGGSTAWVKYTYPFIATSASTKIMFTDIGTSNSLGGYLDQVEVMELNCVEDEFSNGGTCTLWGERDLGEGDTFWNFTDVKPGDQGTNVISLHVDSNDAYVCMTTENDADKENSLVDPEVTAGDVTPGVPVGTNGGELSNYLNVVVWNDDNDSVKENGEEVLYQGLLRDLNMETLTLPTTATDYLGIAWCAGTQPVVTAASVGPVSCDGTGNQNVAQTDSYVSDVVFTAVQQRNNGDFFCPGTEVVGDEQ